MVTGGGFSLLSEAVYLGKPVLSIPLRGQFEQLMNARYLERDGYGICAERGGRAGPSARSSTGSPVRAGAGRLQQDGNAVRCETIERLRGGSGRGRPRDVRRGAARGEEAAREARRAGPARSRRRRRRRDLVRPIADLPALWPDDLPGAETAS